MRAADESLASPKGVYKKSALVIPQPSGLKYSQKGLLSMYQNEITVGPGIWPLSVDLRDDQNPDKFLCLSKNFPRGSLRNCLVCVRQLRFSQKAQEAYSAT